MKDLVDVIAQLLSWQPADGIRFIFSIEPADGTCWVRICGCCASSSGTLPPQVSPEAVHSVLDAIQLVALKENDRVHRQRAQAGRQKKADAYTAAMDAAAEEFQSGVGGPNGRKPR